MSTTHDTPTETNNDETHPSESNEIVAMTEAELFALCTEIAACSYHAASYRGHFTPNTDDLEQKLLRNKLTNWWQMNRDDFL